MTVVGTTNFSLMQLETDKQVFHRFGLQNMLQSNKNKSYRDHFDRLSVCISNKIGPFPNINF